MAQPLITIITVVYNGADTLERTIKSVAGQTYPFIEYIIVDGGSGDGTLRLIDRYKDCITRWVSEPDQGLYYAMNKGIEMSTGDYLWFVNSGDEIFDFSIVGKVFDGVPYADVYYGETLLVNSKGEEIGLRRLSAPDTLCWQDFKRGMLVSHQSFIASRSVISPFRTEYRFSADYEWCLKALKNARRVQNTGLILSRFLEGGLTRHNILAGLKERFRVMKEFFGFWPTVEAHFGIGARFFGFLFRNGRF